MGKKQKKIKKRKVWYCIECQCYIEPESRKFHKLHRGRTGTPTTNFFEKRELYLINGEKVWLHKSLSVERAAAAFGGVKILDLQEERKQLELLESEGGNAT